MFSGECQQDYEQVAASGDHDHFIPMLFNQLGHYGRCTPNTKKGPFSFLASTGIAERPLLVSDADSRSAFVGGSSDYSASDSTMMGRFCSFYLAFMCVSDSPSLKPVEVSYPYYTCGSAPVYAACLPANKTQCPTSVIQSQASDYANTWLLGFQQVFGMNASVATADHGAANGEGINNIRKGVDMHIQRLKGLQLKDQLRSTSASAQPASYVCMDNAKISTIPFECSPSLSYAFLKPTCVGGFGEEGYVPNTTTIPASYSLKSFPSIVPGEQSISEDSAAVGTLAVVGILLSLGVVGTIAGVAKRIVQGNAVDTKKTNDGTIFSKVFLALLKFIAAFDVASNLLAFFGCGGVVSSRAAKAVGGAKGGQGGAASGKGGATASLIVKGPHRLACPPPPSPPVTGIDTRFLEGLRVASTCLIIFFHSLVLPVSTGGIAAGGGLFNLMDLEAFFASPWGLLSLGSELSVDIFFFISGFLFMHLFAYSEEKREAKESATADGKLWLDSPDCVTGGQRTKMAANDLDEKRPELSPLLVQEEDGDQTSTGNPSSLGRWLPVHLLKHYLVQGVSIVPSSLQGFETSCRPAGKSEVTSMDTINDGPSVSPLTTSSPIGVARSPGHALIEATTQIGFGRHLIDLLISIGKAYLKRYLRIAPLMMAVLSIGAFVVKYVQKGTDGDELLVQIGESTPMAGVFAMDPSVASCRQDWWLWALMLGNEKGFSGVGTGSPCMSWFWYLSVEFQLFLVGSLLTLAFYPRRKFVSVGKDGQVTSKKVINTRVVWFISIFICYAATTVMSAVYHPYYTNYYFHAYARGGPYFLGIFVGAALHFPPIAMLFSSTSVTKVLLVHEALKTRESNTAKEDASALEVTAHEVTEKAPSASTAAAADHSFSYTVSTTENATFPIVLGHISTFCGVGLIIGSFTMMWYGTAQGPSHAASISNTPYAKGASAFMAVCTGLGSALLAMPFALRKAHVTVSLVTAASQQRNTGKVGGGATQFLCQHFVSQSVADHFHTNHSEGSKTQVAPAPPRDVSIVQSFLSHAFFGTISPLTFGVYMVHPLLLLFFFSQQSDYLTWSASIYLQRYAAVLGWGFVVGFCLHIFIEVPLAKLAAMLF